MAKSVLKQKAFFLRRHGMSIKDIATTLHIAKSTSSLWCQNISLTIRQKALLHRKMITAGHSGRMKGALMNRRKRIEKIRVYRDEGRIIQPLTQRDLLMLGLGLYLGEGGKGRQFQFTNSNARINILVIRWLIKNFNVSRKHIHIRVFINESHRMHNSAIQHYWSNILNIPLLQFRHTTFIKARWKKSYPNPENYHGVVNIRVQKSTNLQCKINGLLYHILATAA